MADKDFNVELRDVVDSLDDIASALMNIVDSNASSGSNGGSGGGSSKGGKNNKLGNTITKLLGGKGGLGGSLAQLAGGALKAIGPVGAIVGALIKCTKAAADYNHELGKTLSALNGATTASNDFSKSFKNLKDSFTEMMAAIGNSGIGKLITWVIDRLGDAADGLEFLFNGLKFYSDNPDREEIWATNKKWTTDVGKLEAMQAYDKMKLAQNRSGLGAERSEDVTEALLDKAVAISEKYGVAFSDLASGMTSIASSGTGQSDQGLMITQEELNYLAYTTYGVFAESLTPMAKQELVNGELMRQMVILEEQGVNALMDYNANFVKQAKVVDTIKQGLFSFDEVIGLDAKNVGGEGNQGVQDTKKEINYDEIGDEIKKGILDKISDWINEHMPHLSTLLTNVGNNWQKLKSSISQRWEDLKSGKISIWDFITGTTKDIWDFIVETTKDVWTFIKESSKSIWTWIKGKAKPIWDWIKDKSRSIWHWITDKSKSIWTWITGKAKSIWTWISESAKSVWTWIKETSKSVWTWISESAKSVWTWITGAAKSVWTWIKGTSKSVWTWIKGTAKTVWTWIKGKSKDIWDWITSAAKSIWEFVSGTAKSIWDYVTNAMKSIWDFVTSTTKSIWDFITTPIKDGWEYFFGDSDLEGHGGGHAFATGGVVTSEMHATVGEAGKEAIIPLEDNIGISYLANAMKEAGGGSGETTVNVYLSGQILEMSDYNLRRLGEKIGASIDNERNRRGGLNYDQNN